MLQHQCPITELPEADSLADEMTEYMCENV